MSTRTKLSRFRILLLIAVVVIVALVLFILANRNRQAAIPAESIETIQTRNVEQIVSVDGNVVGNDERDMFATAQSQITELDVTVGQHASNGALLGKYQVQTGNVTKTFNLNAPIDGVITAVNYHVNDTVSPTIAVFHMVDTSSFKVAMQVNENDVSGLATDQSAQITIPAVSLDTKYSGKVSFIAPGATSTTGTITYLVDVTPDSLPVTVKPGMSASVDITTASVDGVLAIPESFLIEQNNKDYVKLITWDDEAHTTYTLTQTEITIGLKTDQYVEVKSGLNAGDQILEPSFTVQRKSIFGL